MKKKIDCLQLFAQEAEEKPAQEDLRSQGEARIEELFRSMEEQSQAMKTMHPDFDLKEALKDPVFSKLVGPLVGLTVEQAWCALNMQKYRDAAMTAAARVTARSITNSIRAGKERPQESGADARTAPLAPADYRQATKEQREALKKRIREAAARGEKLYPGM